MKKKLSASILSADFSRLAEEIQAVEKGGIEVFHIDVMDGHFVQNITIGPAVVQSIRKFTKLPFHTHLMIEEPEKFLKPFADVGSDLISFHIEVSANPSSLIDQIHKLGKKAGVAINPETPLNKLEPIYPLTDLVLVMSFNPGFGGQKFIPETLTKITDVKTRRDKLGLKFWIEVDGGVKKENIQKFVDAGSDIIVSGSGIFHQKDYKSTILEMKKILEST